MSPPDGGPLPLTGLYPWEVADSLWLAANHPGLATDEDLADSGREDAEPSEPAPAQQDDDRVTEPEQPDRDEEPQPEQQRPPGPEPLPPSARDDGPPPVAGPGTRHTLAPTAELPAASQLRTAVGPGAGDRPPRDRLSLGRALRPLRSFVASAHSDVLDESATAERIAVAPHLPPVLTPEPERQRSAVLVVDSAPHMTMWRPAVKHFRTMLSRYGGMRDVKMMTLDTADAARALLRGYGQASHPQPPRGLVDPTARQIVFLVTDGVAPAWRSGAAQRLAALWGRFQPVVVLQLLPQRLWPSTGLFPVRVRLRAQGPWSVNAQVHWEPAEPLAASLPRDPSDQVVLVPVLELGAEWLGPWARFVAGTTPRWADMAAILTSTRPLPSPAPSPVQGLTAAELVARFRTRASAEAFALATRLAAVQLDLETMSEVKRQVMPRASRAHLAELLISPLVDPLPGCDGESYVFVDGAREELLAAGSRTATARALKKAAEFLAPRNEAAREFLGYLHGSKESPHSEEALTTVESTTENLRFRQAEHAALQAISGNHLHRARRLGEHIGAGPPTTANTPGSEARRNASRPSPDETLPDDTDSTIPTPGGPQVSTVRPSVESPAPAPPAGGGARPPMPAVWGNMPPRNLVFTGREELLINLERGLQDGPTAVLPHALHGMGGVGKSQLALEYVYRHAAEYEVVCWIPAERPTQIQQAFVELARRLHLPVSSEAITAVPAVLEALRIGSPYGKWLLVFDNAESPAAVQEYFPSAPAGGPVGSVIVTSRNPQWNTLAHPLEVDVFEREESIQLLRRRNPDLSTEDADMLAEVLGDLPLAVEQASAWRAETGMPPAEYLRVFEEKSAELMAVSPPTQYEKTVATAWNVSLDHVEGKNAGAIQLLELCAYFAPEPVSRQFFTNAVSEPIAPELDRIFTDPIRLSRAIREISRYSLAKIDHRTNSIQMHRLVQAVLEARMAEEQRRTFRHGAHLLLAANAPSDPRAPQNWTRFGELYPHVIASQASLSPNRNVRQMVYNVAEYLFYWGDHEAALDFSSETYENWCRLFGEDDQQTLILGRHVRYIMWTMGRYPQAAALGERMLATLEEAGPDLEEEYLRVKGQVSGDRRARGDFRGALEFDEEVYARAVRSYGDEDPETLLHAHNLAVTRRGNGLFREARDLDEASWRTKVQMFGADAPTTLNSEVSLTLDKQELGEYAASEKACEDAVDTFRGTFGDLHPSALRAVARLGVAQRKAGHHEAAQASTEMARTALIDRYGERSPDGLQASLNLSIDLRQNGKLQEALKLGERTRALYAEVFGKDHPHTAAADANLAVTLRLLDRVDEARKLNESALTRFRAPLGDAHPHTLICAINLANDLFAQGDAAAALELDRKTTAALIEKFGESHPTVLVLRGNTASDLRALGRTGEAEELHRSAVDAINEQLGPDHRASADTLAWRRANCDVDPMPI
ncbi:MULTISPECIES: FxSxx-COOH system tetratricopeptide repeat protein [unclassified Streptomyces]|uniref:FxSxx-COOH system tetratricopeptide repeat protein n=1 Tax=unclassified Streptomyces TaxID=2593676 RepID=UPI00225837AB|nr:MULTISPECIES: FxSxx-COOH system tetratricopeptide repeat protein [unclassified Streptomyces]MCX4793842.1 FxSxx-COOH system tetratricopeptide repeat protein [Streptomyces sp. NBC_01242]WSJ35258.1 FxSxx-COOH system tetratricopeptide repeat protein [Streptomyces sp. NBC_01321]WSP61694.1 FxSxx-COOH system tetratricopeptide repeat protein [Streptomyces sp. NBC_01240]WSU20768.1 FxSxx-COOH system tetratricopeptide repeat protein [Streptomyces sp. NBC_01108]